MPAIWAAPSPRPCRLSPVSDSVYDRALPANRTTHGGGVRSCRVWRLCTRPGCGSASQRASRESPLVAKLDRRIRAGPLRRLDCQPRCGFSAQGCRGDSVAVCHPGRKLIGAAAVRYWRSTFAGPNRATSGGVHSINNTNAEFASRSPGTPWAASVPEFPAIRWPPSSRLTWTANAANAMGRL